MSTKADGSIIIDTRIDSAGFLDIKNQLNGMASAAKKLGGAIAAAFSIRAVAQFAKSCLDLGSDLQEVQNVVDVTFTTMNQQVDDFAKNAVNTAGLSETMAKRYVGTFGAMSKAFGFAESEAYAMSTALTQLSGDVASFYNLSQDEAYTKLKSVFTGETESLKDLGVVMTQAALDSYAMANGFGKTTSAMTEQEKVALRYAFVMDQLSTASGDFARTSDGWANQTRLLTLQFEQLKATIGQGLINAFTPVIKVINTVLAGLQRLASAFVQFTSLLFGSAGGISSATSGAQEQLSGIADGYEAAAGGANDLAKGTEKAGKAAQKYLAGFDEIQKLGSKSSSGGSGSGGGGGIGGAAIGGFDLTGITAGAKVEDTVSPQIEAIVAKIHELIAPLREIDFSPLKNSLHNLGDAFAGLGGTIAGALEWAWFNILVPFSKWTIEAGAPAAVDLLASAFEFLDAVLDPVIDGLERMLTWMKPMFEWIGDTFVEVLGWLTDAFLDLAEVFRKKGPQISNILSNLGEAFVAVWRVIEPLMTDLVDLTGEAFGWIMSYIGTTIEYLIDVLEGLTDFIAGVFTGDWKRAWKGVEKAFAANAQYLVDTIDWLLSAFGTSLNGIDKATAKCWNSIKDKTKDVWSGIKSTIKGAVNGIIGLINGMISGLISGINSAISALNKLSVSIPDWVPSVGGKTFGFNIRTVSAPRIPYLAKGAVIPPNAPFMAVLGDQRHGTNIEAPLSTIQEAVAEVMSDIIGAMLAGDEALLQELQEIRATLENVEIGDSTIGEAAVRYSRRMALRNGGSA